MATYKSKVGLSWKYLENSVHPDPNLKIVYDVDVDVAPGELLNFSLINGVNTLVNLSNGGNRPNSFTEEWDAPFIVTRKLADDPAGINRQKIKDEIFAQGYSRVTTTVKINGQPKGETINQTSQNSNIQWD